MKNLIYILFVVLMLVLAFIIMNSGQPKNTIYSDYSINLNKGVNFSNLESYGHTKNSGSSSNIYSSSGLIPSTLNNTSALNGSSYGNTNNLSNSGRLSGGQSGFKSTTSDITTNKVSGGYNISSSNKNDEQSSGEGIGGSLQIPFSRERKTGSDNQKSSNGLIASSGIGSNTGFISAPVDPYGDYNEGDITHPGGDPMGEPIPVGSGTLPLLLFVSSYLLHLYIKRNRNIL